MAILNVVSSQLVYGKMISIRCYSLNVHTGGYQPECLSYTRKQIHSVDDLEKYHQKTADLTLKQA